MTQETKASSTSDHELHIESLLEQMTLEEKVALLAGADFWSTVPIERLGIPAIKVSDGPNGARGGGALVGGVPAASFPVGIALGATWDTELIEQVGQALAEEALSKGARVLLAPTVNLHRSPLNGRNFECYSEDPYLSARLAQGYIRGLQSKGVGGTIKHYIGNESEFERNTINSEIDERALRELYLVPFELAVRETGVWAIMASYNRINGTFASENPRFLIDILKREWGFDGVAMSDWFATHSTAEAANAGLDLEMPGPARFRGEKLVEAVRAGQASEDAVTESARRVLRLIARVGAFEDPTIADEQAIDKPEHRALIRRAGAEAAVLLKNDGVLPLDRGALDTLAVIGPNAKIAQIMGGGSAQINAHYRVTPYDGIEAQVGDAVELGYEAGCTNYKMLPLVDKTTSPDGFTIEYFNNRELTGEVAARTTGKGAEQMWFADVAPGVNPAEFSARLSTRFTPLEGGEHQFSLVSGGVSRLLLDGKPLVDNWDAWQHGDTYFGTGSTEAIASTQLEAGRSYDLAVEYATGGSSTFGIRAVRIGVARPLGDDAIDAAVARAASADVAVVYVGLNSDWETEGGDRASMELAGRQNELVERVAAANPRTVVVLQTGSPVTMPWLDKVAAVLQAWYPGQECGNAIADVLFGAVNPSGKLPQTFPLRLEDNPAFVNYPGENGRVRYGEGIFIGYRYYDKKRVDTLFPFGFGLSYTHFEYANLRMSADTLVPSDTLTVRVDVTNTGERDGQEIVQLYISDSASKLMRPPKELKGFAKVALAAGETKTVELTLDRRSLAYWDDAKNAWVAEAGEFVARVGGGSHDIRAEVTFSLSETAVFDGPDA